MWGVLAQDSQRRWLLEDLERRRQEAEALRVRLEEEERRRREEEEEARLLPVHSLGMGGRCSLSLWLELHHCQSQRAARSVPHVSDVCSAAKAALGA